MLTSLMIEISKQLTTDPLPASASNHTRRGLTKYTFNEFRERGLVAKEAYGSATGIINTLFQYGFSNISFILVQNVQQLTAPNTGAVLLTWEDATSATIQTTILVPNAFVILPNVKIYDAATGTGGLSAVLQNVNEAAAGLYVLTVGARE